MTTVLRKHTKQYHHKSRFARYLQHFRDVGPSHIVTNCTLDFANWTLGFAVLKTEMVNRNYQTRGRVLQIYGEPESPNEGGLFNTYHEPLSPDDGACLTCMLNRYRQH